MMPAAEQRQLEARAKGPNVTPGYASLPDRRCLRRRGFLQFGDAEAGRPQIAAPGSTAASPRISARQRHLGQQVGRCGAFCAPVPLVRDVVIAGINRDGSRRWWC
jgi:hypothetical protein